MLKCLLYIVLIGLSIFIAFMLVDYNDAEGNLNRKTIEDYSSKLNLSISLMTVNILHDVFHDSSHKYSWTKRNSSFNGLISKYYPDVFGVQEASLRQLDNIWNNTKYTYEYFGELKTHFDTNFEHVAIFYKKNKFELIDSGYIYFSERVFDFGTWSRYASYVRLKFKEDSSKIFLVVNLHLDASSYEYRKECSEKLRQHIIEKRLDIGEDSVTKIPLFILGDFNEAPGQGVSKILINESDRRLALADAFSTCEYSSVCLAHKKRTTLHINFGSVAEMSFFSPFFYFGHWRNAKVQPIYNNYNIDWILHSKDNITPILMTVCNEKFYSIDYSDHYAVFGVFYLK